jgi:hypothetical protein
VYPTECPIHDSGPLLAVKLQEAQDAFDASLKKWKIAEELLNVHNSTQISHCPDINDKEMHTRQDYAKCRASLREIQADTRLYERHLEQYKVCRAVIN